MLSNVVFSLDRAGEKALAQRAEGDEADAEFFEGRQHLLLGLSPPQRILALQRRDRLHGMGTADGLHAGLRQAEMPDLALADQVLHGAGDVFDRHVRVDAMLIEEVDDIGLEPLQRSLGDLPDVLRPAVEAALLAGLRIDIEAEFGGDHDLLAEGRQRFADKLLVGERAVDFRGVEEA